MIPRELSVGTEQQQQLALLNWIATLQSVLFRPSPYLQELVEAERRKMRLPTRYIGMHARRGHKWVETAPQPLAAYLEIAQNLSAPTGIRSVLVTTGTFSSGYNKRVLELLAGKQAGFPLHVSLDHVWSP